MGQPKDPRLRWITPPMPLHKERSLAFSFGM
jgi:hypothetical protein